MEIFMTNGLTIVRSTYGRFITTLCLLALCMSSALWSQSQTFTIGGTVLRQGDGMPMTASVCLLRAGLNDVNYIAMDKTVPDNNGQYSFTAVSGYQYKVVAYPWDNDYETQYYNNVSSIEKATVISMSQNRNDVNFVLHQKPSYKNGIAGTVVAANGEAVAAVISMWQVNSSSSVSYTVNTDKTVIGHFQRDNLEPGQYILHVVPVSSKYADGYYRVNAVATKDVGAATPVTVNATGMTQPELSVAVDVSNIVTRTFGIKGMIVDDYNRPLQGALVSVTDIMNKNNGPVATVLSDANGLYAAQWTGTEGAVVVTAEKSGYSTMNASLKVSSDFPFQAVNFTLNSLKKEVFENGVNGRVRDEQDNSLLAKVTALRVQADGSISWNSSETTVVSNAKSGVFSMTSLQPGTYVLFASPGVGGLQPGYYVDGDVATQDPSKATRIEVAEKGVNKEDYLITFGKAIIQKNGFEFYAYIIDDQGQPLEGVTMSAVDASGNEVLANQNVVSDKSGMIHVVFPGPGAYAVTTTKEGYQDAVGTLNFSSSFAVQKAVITMEKTNGVKKQSAAIIADVQDDRMAQCEVYPQPALNVLHLRFTESIQAQELRVSDLQGRVILRSGSNGGTEHSLDVQSLSQGVYLIQWSDMSSHVQSRIFVK